MNISQFVELALYWNETQNTPATSLIYRARPGDARVAEALVNVGGTAHSTSTGASLLELAYRYAQKGVDRAVLSWDGCGQEDVNGDGVVELSDGKRLSSRITIFESASLVLLDSAESARVCRYSFLYDSVPNLMAEDAMAHAFVATCGSTASRVHRMRSHSVLWASIPVGQMPNEVHRHLGGSVYCLFYRGQGCFHRVDPEKGFETLPIRITETNSFQMIALAPHLWYQPINTGAVALQYFMIHEPAFDPSELLVLDRLDCRVEWGFEY